MSHVSCKAILDDNPYAVSGSYRLQPSGPAGAVLHAYCDMDTAGGGWTLCAQYDRDAAAAASATALAAGFGRSALFLAAQPARQPLVANCRLAQPPRQKRVVARVGLQPRDPGELLVINGVANRFHAASLA